jgi:hypothetical protein
MSRISPSGSLAASGSTTSLVNARDRFAVVRAGGAAVRQVSPVFAPAAVSQFRDASPSYRTNRSDVIDASFVDIDLTGDATFIGRLSVAEVYARVAAGSPPSKGRVTDFFV